MPCGGPPVAPDFTQTQKNDFQRLWELQTRQIADVRPTSSACPKLPWDEGSTYSMIRRLHAFFLAFLKKCMETNPLQQQQHDKENMDVDGEPPASIKNMRQSCLEPYARLFLQSMPNNSRFQFILRSGQLIFMVHYEEFMNELNEFEFKGQASNEVLLKNSIQAWLHFFPHLGLPAINATMSLAVATMWRKHHANIFDANPSAASKLERFLDTSQLAIRFLHVSPQHPMADIRTGSVGKLISVKGHVVKARPKRLRVATADFSCPKCGATLTHEFYLGRYSMPTKCVTNDCRSKSFVLLRQTARYTNIQEIRLQESQDESTSHAGRTPRQIEVEFTHDLIDSCRPGDIVLLACCVDAINTAVAAGRAGKRALETSTYKLFLRGHAITTMSESNRRGHQEGSQIVYTQQQLQNIVQLCHADHRCLSLVERRAFPFDLLVRSLCPSIIGHHAVKAGLLLCLLGGTPPSSQSSDRGNSIRSNSHILIVGDPGMYIFN